MVGGLGRCANCKQPLSYDKRYSVRLSLEFEKSGVKILRRFCDVECLERYQHTLEDLIAKF